MMRGRAMFVLAVGVLIGAACGGDDGSGSGRDGGGGGELGGIGDPCVYTRDCGPELYCSELRQCAPAGSALDGEACSRTADCARGLTCVRETAGWLCRTAGDRAIGEPCLRHEQCEAGLFCHRGTCTGDLPDAGTGGFDGGATACSAGSECDDGSNCTADQCIADRCVHTLIDSDMDGHASTVLGACGTDCADMDEGANPDHEGWLGERHGGGPGQPSTFDWNCDGTEEPRWPTVITCAGEACTSDEGWLDPLPVCGDTARWGRCTGAGLSCAPEVLEPARQQTCR